MSRFIVERKVKDLQAYVALETVGMTIKQVGVALGLSNEREVMEGVILDGIKGNQSIANDLLIKLGVSHG